MAVTSLVRLGVRTARSQEMTDCCRDMLGLEIVRGGRTMPDSAAGEW